MPKGSYQTQYFFAGQMTVVFDKDWAVGEDSTGEFASAETKTPDLRVIFWEDVFPTRHKQGLTRLESVPGTTDDLVGWLRANPKADNDDPTCPAKPCGDWTRRSSMRGYRPRSG